MRTLLAILFALTLAGSATAADWTRSDGGSSRCKGIKPDGTCWLTDISEDSSVISVRSCKSWTIVVYGTGADIMPQSCTDSTCATAENLLAASLTGDSPNTFVVSDASFSLVRIDWTAGGAAPTVAIQCGG